MCLMCRPGVHPRHGRGVITIVAFGTVVQIRPERSRFEAAGHHRGRRLNQASDGGTAVEHRADVHHDIAHRDPSKTREIDDVDIGAANTEGGDSAPSNHRAAGFSPPRARRGEHLVRGATIFVEEERSGPIDADFLRRGRAEHQLDEVAHAAIRGALVDQRGERLRVDAKLAPEQRHRRHQHQHRDERMKIPEDEAHPRAR